MLSVVRRLLCCLWFVGCCDVDVLLWLWLFVHWCVVGDVIDAVVVAAVVVWCVLSGACLLGVCWLECVGCCCLLLRVVVCCRLGLLCVVCRLLCGLLFVGCFLCMCALCVVWRPLSVVHCVVFLGSCVLLLVGDRCSLRSV